MSWEASLPQKHLVCTISRFFCFPRHYCDSLTVNEVVGVSTSAQLPVPL